MLKSSVAYKLAQVNAEILHIENGKNVTA